MNDEAEKVWWIDQVNDSDEETEEDRQRYEAMLDGQVAKLHRAGIMMPREEFKRRCLK